MAAEKAFVRNVPLNTAVKEPQFCVIIPKSSSWFATGKLFPYDTKNKDYLPFLKTQLN